MPVAVAIAIRYLIMAAVQLGLWTALERYALPLLNTAIEKIMVAFGVPESTAQDIMANQVIAAFESVGIFAVTLRTKLPIKLAERLGFTTKGYAKRTLPKTVEGQVKASGSTATASKIATSVEVNEIAAQVAKTRGLALPSVKSLLGIIATVIGIPTGFFFALAQYIDFANWQGPYQKTFQGLLAKVGINPDSPMPNARTVSTDTWKKIYTTIEELDPIGISFPFSGVDKPYSRLALADLVDEIAAKLILAGGQATFKSVMALTLPLIQLSGKNTGESAYAPAGATSTFAVSSSTQVKAFTGVVSQGVIGSNTVFTARPDDLIENMAELQTAINNNIAPWIAALPGKIVYEIKVVSSVIIDGLRLVGQAHRIQSGTNTDGTARYKTIYNKFAVAHLYYIKDANDRMKLDDIILGPTNAIGFQPSNAELLQIGAIVSQSVATSDTDQISSIVTNTPTTVVPPATADAPISAPSTGYCFIYDGYKGQVCWNTATVDRLRKEIAAGSKTLDDALTELATRHLKSFKIRGVQSTGEDAWANDNPNVVLTAFDNGLEMIKQMLTTGGAFIKEYAEPVESGPPASAAPTPATATTSQASAPTPLPPAALSATTLYDYYTALGKSLPGIQERADLYQARGLGQAAMYTGNAEQNAKLLSSLKSNPQ